MNRVAEKMTPAAKPDTPRLNFGVFALVVAAVLLVIVLYGKFDVGFSLDPNVAAVKRAIRESVHDPSSLTIVSIDGPRDMFNCENVYRCKFRAKNGFGAVVVNTVYLELIDGLVSGMDQFSQRQLDHAWEHSLSDPSPHDMMDEFASRLARQVEPDASAGDSDESMNAERVDASQLVGLDELTRKAEEKLEALVEDRTREYEERDREPED